MLIEWENLIKIDGIEYDPIYINDVLNSIAEYIDKEAEILAVEKFDRAFAEGNNLLNLIQKITENIKDKFYQMIMKIIEIIIN